MPSPTLMARATAARKQTLAMNLIRITQIEEFLKEFPFGILTAQDFGFLKRAHRALIGFQSLSTELAALRERVLRILDIRITELEAVLKRDPLYVFQPVDTGIINERDWIYDRMIREELTAERAAEKAKRHSERAQRERNHDHQPAPLATSQPPVPTAEGGQHGSSSAAAPASPAPKRPDLTEAVMAELRRVATGRGGFHKSPLATALSA